MRFADDRSRWRALTDRDAAANGLFVYSVKSTGIYCRPTCPARLARRANVGFYDTAADAETAGYRPCKRCKPEAAVSDDPQERAVIKACMIIEQAVDAGELATLKLQLLASRVGLTPRYFHKIFKDKTGRTPKEYAKVQEDMLNENAQNAKCLPDAQMVRHAVDTEGINLPTESDLDFDFSSYVHDTISLGTESDTPSPFSGFGQGPDSHARVMVLDSNFALDSLYGSDSNLVEKQSIELPIPNGPLEHFQVDPWIENVPNQTPTIFDFDPNLHTSALLGDVLGSLADDGYRSDG